MSKFNKKTGLKAFLKVGGALSGMSGLMLDKDVLGARGSAKSFGRSVDSAKGETIGNAVESDAASKAERDALAAQQIADEAAILEKSQESQRQGLKRKGRRASILTSSQGAADPLGIPG